MIGRKTFVYTRAGILFGFSLSAAENGAYVSPEKVEVRTVFFVPDGIEPPYGL